MQHSARAPLPPSRHRDIVASDKKHAKVSVNTIATPMRHAYEKLQVHSKSEAVAKALRDRLVR